MKRFIVFVPAIVFVPLLFLVWNLLAGRSLTYAGGFAVLQAAGIALGGVVGLMLVSYLDGRQRSRRQ